MRLGPAMVGLPQKLARRSGTLGGFLLLFIHVLGGMSPQLRFGTCGCAYLSMIFFSEARATVEGPA